MVDAPTTPSKRLRRFLPDGAIVLLLLGLCLLFFWRIITPNELDRAAFPPGDFSEQFYAYAFFKAKELLSGRLPLWNPYTYSGQPFIADIQSAVFYPIGLINVALAGPRGFPALALEIEAIFHFFLASLFTYLFARRVIGSRFGSLVAALTFTYGGYLTSYPPLQLSILEVQAWLPLILLFTDWATESSFAPSRRLLFTVLAGVALSISTLAGHPMSSMFVIYVSSIYFLFRAYLRTRDERIPRGSLKWIGAYSGLPIFLAIGLGLAAVQIVPTYEFMRLSTRASISYDYARSGFALRDLLQLILPGSVTFWSPIYVGILPLGLALVAVFFKRGRGVALWATLAIVALLISFGGHTFLYSLVRLFAPGFSLFRNQERAAFVFSFSMAMLAGYGGAALMALMAKQTKEELQRIFRVLCWGTLGALLLFMLVSYGNVATGKFEMWLEPSGFLLILMVLLTGILYLSINRLASSSATAALATSLIVFDLFSVNWQTNVAQIKPEDYYRPGPIVELLQGDASLFRVDNEYRLPLNYGCVYQIPDIGGSSPLKLQRYKDLTSYLPRERYWQLLNVKYHLTWEGGRMGSLRHLAEEPQGKETNHLYSLDMFLPRAYIVNNVIVESDDQRTLEILASPSFDPKTTVVLSERPIPQPSTTKAIAASVGVASFLPGRVTLQADLPEDGILVLSENYYPGWKARVDSREEKVYRANYTLRAIDLRAGKHEIEMNYEPLSFKIGAGLSAITLLASTFLVFTVWWQKRH